MSNLKLRILFNICLTVFIVLIGVTNSYAFPSFKWLPESNSTTRKIALDFITEKTQKEALTTVLYSTNITIDGDTVIENIRKIQFYSKQTDVESDGNGIITWDSDIETLSIKEAGIISEDEHYQRIITDNVRVIDDTVYNTFTNQKEVILPFTGLQAGDVSILEYELSYPLSKLESSWATSFYPVIFQNVMTFELTVKSSVNQLKAAITGDRVQCKTTLNEIQCIGKNLNAYKLDTGIVWRDVLDQIHISFVKSWDDIIEDTLTAFNKADFNDKEIKPILESIVGETSNLEDKISLIHEYVSRSIRYISLSELGHRITPHTVSSIHKNRFGDCKDKTAMVIALLRQLDIHAYPVLVATNRQLPSKLEVPSTHYFNHMIACFVINGKQFCIDGTDTSTSWKTMPSWIQGAVSLTLKEGNKPVKLKSFEHRWKASFINSLVINDKGNLNEKQSKTYFNSYAGDVRSTHRPKTKEDLQKYLKDEYKNWVSDKAIPSFSFKGLDTLENSYSINSNTEYENFLTPGEAVNFSDPDHWLRYELIYSKLKTEFFDTKFEGIKVDSTIVVDISKLWLVNRKPYRLLLSGPFGEMIRDVHLINDNKIEIRTTLDIPKQIILKTEIKEFNEYLDLLANNTSIQFQANPNLSNKKK